MARVISGVFKIFGGWGGLGRGNRRQLDRDDYHANSSQDGEKRKGWGAFSGVRSKM